MLNSTQGKLGYLGVFEIIIGALYFRPMFKNVILYFSIDCLEDKYIFASYLFIIITFAKVSPERS